MPYLVEERVGGVVAEEEVGEDCGAFVVVAQSGSAEASVEKSADLLQTIRHLVCPGGEIEIVLVGMYVVVVNVVVVNVVNIVVNPVVAAVHVDVIAVVHVVAIVAVHVGINMYSRTSL